jgi:hypothetical protein
VPDTTTISRVAKILARATSPEENEAKSALDHAYKRMVRDGVTLQDLLTLPETELFQGALVRLVDVILNNQENLSPSSKRAAYAEYMRLIVAKFSGGGEGAHSAQQQSREEAAREYQQRNGYTKRPRGQGTTFSQENVNSFNGENVKTNKPENNKTFFGENVPPQVVWVINVIRSWFQPGSILWHTSRSPGAMFRLLLACILWGMGFAIVLMTVAAFAHILTKTNPVIDVQMRILFPLLTVIGTVIRMKLFMRTV